MRFEKECEGRKLRLHFSDGVVVEGLIIDVADPDDGDGFVYDEIPQKPEAFWAEFRDLEKYDILES
jgi:hypothetical protein